MPALLEIFLVNYKLDRYCWKLTDSFGNLIMYNHLQSDL